MFFIVIHHKEKNHQQLFLNSLNHSFCENYQEMIHTVLAMLTFSQDKMRECMHN